MNTGVPRLPRSWRPRDEGDVASPQFMSSLSAGDTRALFDSHPLPFPPLRLFQLQRAKSPISLKRASDFQG